MRVGFILGLSSEFWQFSRSELEAGNWALVFIVGELLFVPREVSTIWPGIWSIIGIRMGWLMIIVGEIVVVVAI